MGSLDMTSVCLRHTQSAPLAQAVATQHRQDWPWAHVSYLQALCSFVPAHVILSRQGNGGSEHGLWGPDGLSLYPGSSPISCVLLARSLNSLAEKERSDCFPGSDGTSSRGTGCDRVMVGEATLLKVGPAPLHPAQGRMESSSESPAWS